MHGVTFLKRFFQVSNINPDGTHDDLVFEQQEQELFDFDSNIGILHVLS